MGKKRPWLLPALAGIELVLAVVLAALCALYIYYTVLNNRLAQRLLNCHVNKQAFTALVNDSVIYGTRSNPAVMSALSEAGVRFTGSTNAPANPAARTPKPAR